jgi:drug/metabolite transporter (DMT)-like permease
MKRSTTMSRIKVGAALASIYLIWGTTYAAIRVVVTALPMLLAASARFSAAGAALAAVLLLRGEPWPRPRHWTGPAVSGLLMLLGSHGLVSWAQQSVPSGLAAVVMATIPMWIALLDWLVFGARRPNALVTVGLLIGFSGVFLLARPGGAGAPSISVLAITCAPPLWALGSLLSPRLAQPSSSLMATALQMLSGGAALFAAGSARGELSLLGQLPTTPAPWLALGYLALFGSIVALGAYGWLLREVGAGPVSTYAFVNPLVAVLFGHLALSETLSPGALLSGALVLAAVALVLLGRFLGYPNSATLRRPSAEVAPR